MTRESWVKRHIRYEWEHTCGSRMSHRHLIIPLSTVSRMRRHARHEWKDTQVTNENTHASHEWVTGTWSSHYRLYVCDMTHTYVGHDLFIDECHVSFIGMNMDDLVCRVFYFIGVSFVHMNEYEWFSMSRLLFYLSEIHSILPMKVANKSCRTYGWVTSHIGKVRMNLHSIFPMKARTSSFEKLIWMPNESWCIHSNDTCLSCMNTCDTSDTWHTYEWVMTHIRMGHDTHMNGSFMRNMAHVSVSHVNDFFIRNIALIRTNVQHCSFTCAMCLVHVSVTHSHVRCVSLLCV